MIRHYCDLCEREILSTSPVWDFEFSARADTGSEDVQALGELCETCLDALKKLLRVEMPQ